MNPSLIEKLEALKKPPSSHALEMMGRQEINNVLNEAIAIVRQHQAEPPKDVVERVAAEIQKMRLNDWCDSLAVAVIAVKTIQEAMSSGRATIAPVSAETVQPITPAISIATFNELNAASNITDERGITDEELDRAVKFLARMGDASARKDEGEAGATAHKATSASNISASPASEAYQKVKEALQLARCRSMNGKFVYDEALAALPSLITVAPSEIPILEELHKYVESQIMAAVDLKTDENGPWIEGTDTAATLVLEYLRSYLHLPSPQVDIEAGAIACSQWVYGANHGKPSWDRLSEEHRNEYREQAKACARVWGLKWE